MWQPPPPPKPPRFGEEYLLQMADYYQALVEYHQEAAEQAKERLFHLSMLLGDYPTLKATLEERRSVLTNGDNQSDLEKQERLSVVSEPEASLSEPVQSLSNKELEAELAEDEESENLGMRASSEPLSLGDRRAEPSNDIPEGAGESTSIQEPEAEPVEEASAVEEIELTAAETDELPEEPSQELVESLSPPPELEEKPIPTEDEIEALLEANRGKFLHVEFMAMDLVAPKQQYLPAVTAQVKKQLRSGEQKGRWERAPEEPNCWTIDLDAIPDLAEKKKAGKKPARKTGKSSMLPSARLDKYPTLKEAIQDYIQENRHKRCKTADIYNWLYPEGVPTKEDEERIKKTIGNALWGNEGKMGWVKVGTGEYAWTGV